MPGICQRRRLLGLLLVLTLAAAPMGRPSLAAPETPLRCFVLVLPLQSDVRDAAGNVDATLGLAVANLLDDALLPHSGLDDCWDTPHLNILFPTANEYRTWVAGKGEPPDSLARLKLRFVVGGRVRSRGDGLVADLWLRDLATGKTHLRKLPLEFAEAPHVRAGYPNPSGGALFRMVSPNYVGWLVEAGVPAPPAERVSAMAWPESLSRAALSALGQGIYDLTLRTYERPGGAWTPSRLEEARKLAPRSYLVLNNLGWARFLQGRHGAARELFQEAWKANPAGVSAAQGMISCAVAAGQEDEALAWAVRKAAAQGRPEKKARAGTWQALGNRAAESGDWPRAIGRYEKSLALQVEMGDRDGQATLLALMGLCRNRAGQYDRAMTCYLQALDLRRATKDRVGEGKVLNELGSTSYWLSRYEQAITWYETALRVHQELKRADLEGVTLIGLGSAHEQQGRYDRAIEAYERALALTREAKDRPAEGFALNSLGGAYKHLVRYDRAIPCFEQALSIHREIHDRSGEAVTLNNLGLVSDHLGEYDRAVAHFTQALAAARATRDRFSEAHILNNLGLVQIHQGRYQEAIDTCTRALEIERVLHARSSEGDTLHNLGRACLGLSRPGQAFGFLEQALLIRREVKDRAGEARTLAELMSYWRVGGNPRAAIFYGKLSIDTWQEIRSHLRRLDKETQAGFARDKEAVYRQLADLMIIQGRIPEAQRVIDLLKIEEYEDFVRGAASGGSMDGIALTAGEKKLHERYVAIADRVVALGNERGELMRKERRTEVEEKRLLALEEDMRVVRAEFDVTLRRLSAEMGNATATGERIQALETTRAMQESLREMGEGTVVVYTLVGKDTYRAILVTPDIYKTYEVPVAAVDLYHKVFALQRALRRRTDDPLLPSHELYRVLVEPMAADLEKLHVKTIMWSLDGVLRYIPVNTLHDGKQFLVERYASAVFTVATPVSLGRAPAAAWRVAALGVSKAHAGFSALPSVPRELTSIAREEGKPAGTGMLPGIIRLDEAFTQETLQRALLGRFPVIHIASHFAFVPGDETDSFLLLGDGKKLDLSEIRTYAFEGVDLLTLSACGTAMGGDNGNGREVESFAVLAQKRGAHAVIATLWPVADESTQALMRDFYRIHETTRGISKLEALRQAQLRMLREKPAEGGRSFSHPFYWAPFILIGSGR